MSEQSAELAQVEGLALDLMHAKHSDNPAAPRSMVHAGAAMPLAEALWALGWRRRPLAAVPTPDAATSVESRPVSAQPPAKDAASVGAALTAASGGAERVLTDVANERERQVAKGWTREHDDTHHTHTLVRLAMSRTHQGWMTQRGHSREGLIEAAAMLVAAVEAMDRAADVRDA